MIHDLGVQSGRACWLWGLVVKKWHSIRQKEGENYYDMGLSELREASSALQFVARWFVQIAKLQQEFLQRFRPKMSTFLLLLKLSSVKLLWKSLMNDYGLRAWISMRCVFSTRRNVFIILCNDSLDNNSFSSEGISIKMEESIKMLYARIYKLGNFLDYCNHLQNWLFQCGIDRF